MSCRHFTSELGNSRLLLYMAAVWTGEDEAKLLDCIEDRGFGNWWAHPVKVYTCISRAKLFVIIVSLCRDEVAQLMDRPAAGECMRRWLGALCTGA